jgi:hypothetical protein
MPDDEVFGRAWGLAATWARHVTLAPFTAIEARANAISNNA